MAEGIMKAIVNKYELDIFVDSAGTSNYHIGQPPDKRAIASAQKHNLDITNLKARQFEMRDFELFDFIFVMDSSNYSDVIAMAKNSSERNNVEMILNRVYPNANMSVPDPYFGGEQGFENVFVLLNNACEIIATSLKENKENE
jgi:protein-tyrosine phosphatase